MTKTGMSPQCFTRYFSCSVCRSAPHCNEKKEITKGKLELKHTMQDLKITCISAKGFFSLRIRDVWNCVLRLHRETRERCVNRTFKSLERWKLELVDKHCAFCAPSEGAAFSRQIGRHSMLSTVHKSWFRIVIFINIGQSFFYSYCS